MLGGVYVLSLCLKDLLLQKQVLKFILFYPLFIFAVFMKNEFVYVMGAMAMAYMMIMYGIYYDDKNKSDMVLNSFPIAKKNIVLSKYLSSFLFGCMGIVGVGIAGGILKMMGMSFPMRWMNIEDIIATFVGVGILSMIYFPIYFRFGYAKARIIGTLLFVGVFCLGMPILSTFLSYLRVSSISMVPFTMGIIVRMMIIFILSIFLSIRAYERREV